MQFKTNDFDRVMAKLGITTIETHHKIAWFVYKGKRILKTRRSQGSGDIPACDKIRQQLKVNEDQMRGLINCPFTLDDYISHLKQKGLIPPEPQNPQ